MPCWLPTTAALAVRASLYLQQQAVSMCASPGSRAASFSLPGFPQHHVSLWQSHKLGRAVHLGAAGWAMRLDGAEASQ